MQYFSHGTVKIMVFIAACLLVLAILPKLSPVFYPPVPPPSDSFDCDDSALTMYRHFESLGIESTPFIGNLDLKGEEFTECNHVWLLVKADEHDIAYDWGEPRFDNQHYEGYSITLDDLLYAVEQDKNKDGILVSAEY